MKVRLIRQTGHERLEGTIECMTGLHIGNPGEVIEIGGLENAIIKHPITQEPYIPGSSLKGQMRALLELWEGKVMPSGEPHKCQTLEQAIECPICRIFGLPGDADFGIGPARLIVRDANLRSVPGGGSRTQTEVKWENVINRLSGTADNPRQVERVPAGTTFHLELGYRQFEMEAWTEDEDGRKVPQQISSDQAMLASVKKALRLLELDTLGGSGSRGYGKVAFRDLRIVHQDGTHDPVDIKEVEL